MKLGISFVKTITYQLRWFVLIMEVETSSWYVLSVKTYWTGPLWDIGGVWISSFHNSQLKNGGTHDSKACLDFNNSVSSFCFYHSIFSFHNSIFNGIFVIKITYGSHSHTFCSLQQILSFFFFFGLSLVWDIPLSVFLFLFFSFFSSFHFLGLVFFFFFSFHFLGLVLFSFFSFLFSFSFLFTLVSGLGFFFVFFFWFFFFTRFPFLFFLL